MIANGATLSRSMVAPPRMKAALTNASIGQRRCNSMEAGLVKPETVAGLKDLPV